VDEPRAMGHDRKRFHAGERDGGGSRRPIARQRKPASHRRIRHNG
jgi:hypothetical protein